MPCLIAVSFMRIKLASMLFEKVTYGDVSDKERNKVRSDLEKYCGRDTEGMIWIVERLRELSL